MGLNSRIASGSQKFCSKLRRSSSCQWCLFLRNHDELAGVYHLAATTCTTCIKSKTMRLNLAISKEARSPIKTQPAAHRVDELDDVSALSNHHYGDEIGMGDNISLGIAMSKNSHARAEDGTLDFPPRTQAARSHYSRSGLREASCCKCRGSKRERAFSVSLDATPHRRPNSASLRRQSIRVSLSGQSQNTGVNFLVPRRSSSSTIFRMQLKQLNCILARCRENVLIEMFGNNLFPRVVPDAGPLPAIRFSFAVSQNAVTIERGGSFGYSVSVCKPNWGHFSTKMEIF